MSLRIGVYQRLPVGGGGGLHADTINWQNRVQAKGGSVSIALNAVDTFVKGVYADNLRAKILYCNIFATNTFNGLFEALWFPAGVPSEASNVNYTSNLYEITTGLRGGDDGVETRGLTGFIPSTHLTATNNHLAVYLRSLVSSKSYATSLSAGTASDREWSLYGGTQQDANAYYSAFAYSSGGFLGATTNNPGFLVGQRDASNFRIFLNGSQIGIGTPSGTSVIPSTELWIGSSPQKGWEYEDRPIAFISAGQALTATDATAFYNRVQALQTALGRQV